LLSQIKIRNEYLGDIIRGALVRDTWKCLEPCDVLIIRHNNDCGYNFDEKAYAPLIDSLGDLCTKKSLRVRSVAKHFSVFVGKRAQYSPVSYNQALIGIGIIKIITWIFKNNQKSESVFESLRVRLWCQILEKCNPGMIISIQPDEYLCRAGKKKGIPVYDLQHGAIAEEDPVYREKYRVSTPIEDLPDGFLCWDDRSVATISKWAQNKGIRVLNIGNPWFLRFQKNTPDDRLVSEALDQGKIHNENPDRPSVLVTLQWGLKSINPDARFNGVMTDALEKVILDTENVYNWILRLHPVQLRGKEREMTLCYLRKTFGEEKTQSWLTSSYIPLPVVLRQTDLHITYHSTVVIEAAWMGVRSALLNQQICKNGEWESIFAHERSIGMAEVVPQDSDIIKQWISSTLAKGRAESTMQDSSQALDAFLEEIVTWCKS